MTDDTHARDLWCYIYRNARTVEFEPSSICKRMADAALAAYREAFPRPSITLDVSPRVTRHLRRPTGEGPDERGQGTPGAEGGG